MPNKFISASLLAALFLVGCLRAPDQVDHSTVVRSDGKPMTMAEMEHAIRRAAYLEEWQRLDLVEPGHFIATHYQSNDTEYATVDILYTATDFSIHYKDSKGMRYDGVNHVIGPHYQSMVQDLAQRISDVVLDLGGSGGDN